MTSAVFIIRRLQDLGFAEVQRDQHRIVLRNADRDVTIVVPWDELGDETVREARKALRSPEQKKRSRAGIAKRKAQADRALHAASSEHRQAVLAEAAERRRLIAEESNFRFYDHLMRSTPGR